MTDTPMLRFDLKADENHMVKPEDVRTIGRMAGEKMLQQGLSPLHQTAQKTRIDGEPWVRFVFHCKRVRANA